MTDIQYDILTGIFNNVYDVCSELNNRFSRRLLTKGNNIRVRNILIHPSEIITICVFFPYSGFKTFKQYYESSVLCVLHKEFKNLPCYSYFLQLREKVLNIFVMLLCKNMRNKCTGISYIDSFCIKVCHNKRIYNHKVFKGLAGRSKTSMDWFYGFKLHLLVNTNGEVVNFCFTAGNIPDNDESVLNSLLNEKVYGSVYGDKGYLINKNKKKKLKEKNIRLITRKRKNMKNKANSSLLDGLFLNKRNIIESIGNILKNVFELEHTRHRSSTGLISHIFSTMIAYIFKKRKPSTFLQINAKFHSDENTLNLKPA